MADQATDLLLYALKQALRELTSGLSSIADSFWCDWNPERHTLARKSAKVVSVARKQKPISQEEQSRRFEEAAREAGVDTSDETLERLARQVVKPAPKPAKSPRKK